MTYKERYSPDIPFVPYLRLPIRDTYQLNEGYIYSQEERKVHGWHIHGGLDFDCEFGTSVYAAASGYAVSTYHRFVDKNKNGSIRLYKGKPLGMGFGYMIQIYHFPEITRSGVPRITQYGHLSHIIPEIKPLFFPPKNNTLSKEELRLAEKYPWILHNYGFHYSEAEKELYAHNFTEILQKYDSGSPFVAKIEQGQLIGKVGNSGILYGELNQKEASEKVSSPDGVLPLDTWDAPHLHFEEATRNENGLKIARRDPYNLYLSRKWYQGKLERSLFV